MSGASITVTIEDARVRRAFARLARTMENTRPVMERIGTGLVASVERRFVSQTDPDGNAWAALNPGYASDKRNSRILTESGRLRGSINKNVGSDQVRVGTNTPYAAIHQFGGTITPKSASHLMFRIGGGFAKVTSVTLPARPYLGISEEDHRMIGEVVEGFVARAVR